MKQEKSAILTYVYDDEGKTVTECFGTSMDRLTEIGSKIVDKPGETFTGCLIEMLESNEVSGGELLALAIGGIKECAKAALLKKMLGAIGGLGGLGGLGL